MISGTFTGNTSFTATAASVNVPTGVITCTERYNTITVPNGVRVLKFEVKGYNRFCTIGVTPGKTYSKIQAMEFMYDDGSVLLVLAWRDGDNRSIRWAELGEEGQDCVTSAFIDFTLSYSPQINTLKPDYTDY